MLSTKARSDAAAVPLPVSEFNENAVWACRIMGLFSFRGGGKWPAMSSSGGVRTNHDTSCNAYYHAMASPVLHIPHGNCPLPMQFACDRVLLPVRRCTNVVTDKCSSPLDRHIDIGLFSRNIS